MSSMISVGGLSSGLDTEAIVSQLLAVERIPITQTQSKQAALRSVDNAWSDIVTKLSAIRTALDKLDSPSDYGTHTAVSSSSDAVAVTRTGAPVPGGLSFTVSQLASTYQGALSGTTALTSADDPVGDGMLRIRHADGDTYTEIDTTGKTLTQVANAITSSAGLQANASVQRAADGTMRLVVSSRRSGADGALELDLSAAPDALSTETQLFAGRDALLTMGTGPDALQVSSPTNRMTDLIAGVTIDLKQTTTAPVTVEVERDPETTIKAVRELVDAMNAAISTLKSRTAYNAGSDTAGILQGDQVANSLRFDLSGVLMSAVPGVTGEFPSAKSIGIEVGRDGLLTLDEDALSSALAKDHEGVLATLTAPAEPEAGQPGPGLLTRLDAMLKTYEGRDGRIAATRQGLTDRIDAYDDQIERYEVRLELRERMLRLKWSGLESSLGVVQAQGATLLSALGYVAG